MSRKLINLDSLLCIFDNRLFHAQLVITRRCNLTCSYCNEFDNSSEPVPLDLLLSRIDRLVELGMKAIDITGGEPLLHPDLEKIVDYLTRKNVYLCVISNGYLLTEEILRGLETAGMDELQISIDNFEPDAFSMKSFNKLKPKLKMLADGNNKFSVTINTVLSSGTASHFKELVGAMREMGFNPRFTIHHVNEVGLIDEQVIELARWYHTTEQVHHRARLLQKPIFDRLEGRRPEQWICQSGRKTFYVDEFGMVRYCSQMKMGKPKNILEYTKDDLRKEGQREKGCERDCSIGCHLTVSIANQKPLRALQVIGWEGVSLLRRKLFE